MSTISIEEQAMQTYQENISYFQEHQPRVFQKILDFESAIEHGHYEAKYELEYKDEGYFDVKEIESGRYLFGIDSNSYAKKASRIVNYKKNESTFKTFYDHDFSAEELNYFENSHDIASSPYYAYSKIMAYRKNLSSQDDEMLEIKKFIFFGVGLGGHLLSIDKKVKAENYLIVEDDLELFRLSMFVTSYKELSSSAKLFFCVFEEQDYTKALFDSFLEKSFYYNHYIKYFQMQNSDDSKVKLMQTVISGQRHLIFLYSAYFLVYLRALEYIKDGYNFLDVSAKDESDTFLGKPVILVAAGPSLGKNLDWLEKNRDRFTIVALTATLKTLEKRGIKPDIVTHLDPFEKTCMVHIDAVENREFYEDCMLFCGTQTPKILIDKFQKDKVFIAQVSTSYKKGFDSIEPICVGSFTYMLLAKLGVRELYSLGMDLALDKESGTSHTKDHKYNRKLDTTTVDKVEDDVGYLKAVIKTKGNFEDEVLATLTFDKSISVIKQFSKYHKKEYQNFYNLSDGAYLDGLEPKLVNDVDIDDMKVINKKTFIKKLHKSLKDKSSNKISDSELKSMKRRYNYVKELKTKIKNHTFANSFNKKLYQSQLLGLTLDILDEYDTEAVDLHNIYLSYLSFIMPFIFDLFNTKGLKNEKKHIKALHPLLIKYCLEILEHYEKHIEMFFEEEKVH